MLGTFAFLLAVRCGAADSLEDAIRQTALDYTQRREAAAKELNAVRERIATEEGTLAKAVQELQNRIVALETEIARQGNDETQSGAILARTQREFDGLKRNLNYVTTQGAEALKGFPEILLPGENLVLGEALKRLQEKFADPVHPADAAVALETLEFFSGHVTRTLGGYRTAGSSLIGQDNRIRQGTFVFLGPETFFQTDAGDVRGTVRLRDGGRLHPVTFPLPGWTKEKAAPLFQGQMGTVFSDPSGGKALRLRETKGTFLEHVHKGGMVAYLIIAVGGLSLVIIGLKIVDARNLQVDAPSRVQPFLKLVAQGKLEDAGRMLPTLRATTRAVFAVGLQHTAKSKDALEEHLLALLQEQRLHFERRLPLLTVIATASPLMGLLGTVMGMVKTFSLITVFGTGNAAKLSSGISEVLVTTELGLAVAIPTLVAHGFLAHQIHKKLSLLERYASEFVAAAEEARLKNPAAAIRETLV